MRTLTMMSLAVLVARPALAFEIKSIDPQKLDLGTQVLIAVEISADSDLRGNIDLEVDRTALADKDAGQDVVLQLSPTRLRANGSAPLKATLTLTVRTSAPTIAGGEFTVRAKASQNGAQAEAKVALDVNPHYVVHVFQARPGSCDGNKTVTDKKSWICDFDSPDVAYFRPHAEGLTFEIQNKTNESLYIHGNGAIKHQDTSKPPLAPGDTYPLTIPGGPDDPRDVKGAYSLHTIYKPERQIVINAETIPAAAPR
jgi:hypothetical protein